jgi:hypothetical protein
MKRNKTASTMIKDQEETLRIIRMKKERKMIGREKKQMTLEKIRNRVMIATPCKTIRVKGLIKMINLIEAINIGNNLIKTETNILTSNHQGIHILKMRKRETGRLMIKSNRAKKRSKIELH